MNVTFMTKLLEELFVGNFTLFFLLLEAGQAISHCTAHVLTELVYSRIDSTMLVLLAGRYDR